MVRAFRRGGRSRAAGSGPVAEAATARRLRRAPIGDVRLWLGLVLVSVSMLTGARLMAADDETVLVLRATRDLAVGSAPDALAPVRVARSAAGDRYLVEQPQPGSVLRWPIAAGELVPASAIAIAPVEPVRRVTVPVDPLHAPPGLQPGDLVDAWSSPPRDEAGPPVLVLTAAAVAGVTADGGISGEIGVVLQVPVDEVAALVSASRTGAIDLVAVPVASQSAGRDVVDATPPGDVP